MIERMAKLTLLFHHSNKDELLTEMQRLGLFHIENFGVNQTEEIAGLSAKVLRLTHTERYLRSVGGGTETTAPDLSEDQVVDAVAELRETIASLESEQERLRTEIAQTGRWGDFDPESLARLAAAGYVARLYSAPRSSIGRIAAILAKDETRLFEEVLEERGTVSFLVLSGIKEPPPEIDATDQRFPAQSLKSLRVSAESVSAELQSARGKVAHYVPSADLLASRARDYQNLLSMRLADASLESEAEGLLYAVIGWLPQRQLPAAAAFLDKREVYYTVVEPDGHDKVPILLRNRPYSRLFEPIMRIFSLPSYHELDTTPFLAPFYTIFFGLCVADMAYGLVLLVAAFLGLILLKRRSARPLLFLGLVLAGSVTLMGLFLNSFGGLKVTDIFGENSALAKMVLFHDMNGAMYLAIAMGFIQVTVGHILKVFNEIKEFGPLGALEPTGVVFMFLGLIVFVLHFVGPSFSIGVFPVGALGAAIPQTLYVAFALIGVGLVLMFLFNHLKSKIYARIGLGFIGLYEFAIGSIGDILSYMRLFALGLAGGLLGESMVQVALLVRGNHWWGYIPMVIVLLLGSGINLSIGLLSAFVHSLRLTFVEFYKAVGFKGGGTEYAPFKLR